MLAIIIPYYKLTFFDATLESLANQNDNRFTVYIGDDNSTESPLAVLGNYEHKLM
jgi:glycosyltransferase involved in cell wall biosynthesis